MNPVNMRLYRRFDADLIALHEAGIPVNVLAEVLLETYADGKQIRIVPERFYPFNPSDAKQIHLNVPVHTDASVSLLRQIRYGYRNQFVKNLVRNALVVTTLCPYFSEDARVKSENDRLREIADTDHGIVVLPYGLKRNAYRKLLIEGCLPVSEKTSAPSGNAGRRTRTAAPAPAWPADGRARPDGDDVPRTGSAAGISTPASTQPARPIPPPRAFDDLEGWDSVPAASGISGTLPNTDAVSGALPSDHTSSRQAAAGSGHDSGGPGEEPDPEADANLDYLLDNFDIML